MDTCHPKRYLFGNCHLLTSENNLNQLQLGTFMDLFGENVYSKINWLGVWLTGCDKIENRSCP